MGLLVLSAVAALALTFVTLVTVLVVKLVMLVTVPNTILLLVLAGAVHLEQSRRSCIAKGYYSCTRLPSDDMSSSQSVVSSQAVEPKVEPSTRKAHRADSVSSTESEEELDDSEPLTASVDTPAVEAPRSGGRLPELRRQRLTAPSKSFQESSKSVPSPLRRSTGSFPAHGKTPNYINRDPIAAERKQMKAALETEGYWIGDFRTQQPSFARRSKQPVSPAHGRDVASTRTRLVPHAV
ncbi:hypothetical protein P43SY_000697 [Pythium insidiosum]|uniref:Transmembrane protein n=1 Tax=Pythium insidiosum TaxID=114742 RepID=A0AAD5QEI3_PYTIN|nr:hypothetical protein P43SY_000697 [Pythium insidiosum]